MAFYEEMAAFANEILSPTSAGGLGQGAIKLVTITAGPPPDDPWLPPNPPTRTETILKGAARGVSANLVGSEVAPGVQLVATDLIVIVAPWGGTASVVDILEVDGDELTIMRVDRIPAAGTISAWKFYVRQ